MIKNAKPKPSTIIEFHKLEYGELRAVSLKVLTFAEKILPSDLVFSAGFYSWLITFHGKGSVLLTDKTVWNLSLCVPVVTTLVAILLSFGAHQKIQLIGRYLRKIEERLGDSQLGWENFQGHARFLQRLKIGSTRGITSQVAIALIAWLLVLVFNLAAIFYLGKF